METALCVLGVVALVIGLSSVVYGILAHRARSAALLATLDAKRSEIEQLREQAQRDAQAQRREALVEARDEAQRLRVEIERENREARAENQRLERRLASKEETLDRRQEAANQREQNLQAREAEVLRVEQEAEGLRILRQKELERVSGLTTDEARAAFLKLVEDDCRHEAARKIREIEEGARREGERRARNIVVQAIQRCAVEQTSESTVSVVPLPNDEMKGRIIGREGRNIRAFETLTGVDLIVDDTPDSVVLSAFDPIRREEARIALTNLVSDGRIHPGRIEETIQRAKLEVEEKIQVSGESALLETGVTGVAPDLVRLLGRMRYRTSYGQNVLDHSVEISHLCGLLAAEVGADVRIAKRAGLFHDIGKAVDHDVEGTHAAIGADLLRRMNESAEVVAAVEAHHGEVEPSSVEAILVMCADSISASRPGARRETLETYVKRLKRLEEIGDSCPGVEKTFAVQAGREIRVIVRPEVVDDLGAMRLAQETARRIEEEMEYPGQIRVTVIRETRATDFAR